MELHNYIVAKMHTMQLAHPLPDPLIDLIADRFRVMAEPMRIKILDHLREGPAAVGELAAALDTSHQNVSKHLGILHSAQVVGREKDGNRVRYEISDPTVFDLCENVCGGLRERVSALDAVVPR